MEDQEHTTNGLALVGIIISSITMVIIILAATFFIYSAPERGVTSGSDIVVVPAASLTPQDGDLEVDLFPRLHG